VGGLTEVFRNEDDSKPDGRTVPATSTGWYVVGLLAVLYAISFVDRLILTLLVEPLKADLGLRDTQMGLLIGLGFAVVYTIAGFPAAQLIDSGHRRFGSRLMEFHDSGVGPRGELHCATYFPHRGSPSVRQFLRPLRSR